MILVCKNVKDCCRKDNNVFSMPGVHKAGRNELKLHKRHSLKSPSSRMDKEALV